jgi:hypothetical protein
MPKIQGRELTESDIGSNVTYKPNHAKDDPSQWEHGKLSSFRYEQDRVEGTIFVRFKGPNGERCNPENLVWG